MPTTETDTTILDLNEIDAAQAKAARSFTVRFRNETSNLLVRSDYGLDHGIWNSVPPEIIFPGASVSWQNDSNGFMTGAQGYVNYMIIENNTSSGKFQIWWDNPFVGTNRSGAIPRQPAPGCVLVTEGGGGDNALLNVTLKRG
jgi:hypothetical protein